MELVWIILGAVFIIGGFISSFLPVLPGPPVSFVGLLLLRLTSPTPFSLQFFIIWALIIGILMILDNVIPAYGTKKLGGTSYGIGGSMVGLVVGIFFSPVGLILGPLVGAFLGELVAGQTSNRAIKSALGSFFGFLASTLLKVLASGIMGYYFFTSI
ncbi:MAG: DUF456 domain-containing protein [Balneolaceae bacterium]|nr:DUF456 domain-containing protein [Balneolaceae bacterium]